VTFPTIRSAEPFNDESLEGISRSLRDSGMAVIEDAYRSDEIDRLGSAYDALLAERPSSRVQATGEEHVQMQMPLIPPFCDARVVAHPAVVQVLANVLGPDFECAYYNSNTACQGSKYQAVHRDHGPVFGLQHGVATPPTGLVVNIPLCDFTVENGSTEVWPATHLIVDTPADTDVSLGERAEALASSRLNIKAGSLLMRDLRVWHRGTPNTTKRPRSMLAIVYKRHWIGWRHASLRVPMSTWEAWPDHVRLIFATAPKE
jgi:hypothetical protein